MPVKLRDIPVGSTLLIGSYKQKPVSWIKAGVVNKHSDEVKLVSSYVLDIMPYDSREGNSTNRVSRFCGSPDFRLSNLKQFMTSTCFDGWFEPQHECDAYEPKVMSNLLGSIVECPTEEGLMYGFEGYEMDGIKDVRLPYDYEISQGKRQLKYFRNNGIRSHPTDYLCHSLNRFRGRSSYITTKSFIPYWLMPTYDTEGNYTMLGVMRTGYIGRVAHACYPCGVRPLIVVKGSTQLDTDIYGAYRISHPKNYIYTQRNNDINTELFNELLGFL